MYTGGPIQIHASRTFYELYKKVDHRLGLSVLRQTRNEVPDATTDYVVQLCTVYR